MPPRLDFALFTACLSVATLRRNARSFREMPQHVRRGDMRPPWRTLKELIPEKGLVLMLAGLGLAITALSCEQSGGDRVVRVMNTLTFHMNRQRTGWNPMESVLTPANVSGPSFGPLWNSPALDSVTIGSTTYPPHLYASPLYVDSVLITDGPYGGQQFGTVFAATSNDYVYAINAFDVVAPRAVPTGTILWSKSLGQPTNFAIDGGVAMGILGTPIIDLDATPPTMYVAAAIDDSGGAWKVFALDIRSGAILPGWPLVVSDAALALVNQNGPAEFQSASAMSQRGGLNLSPDGSTLYVPFGGFSDTAAGWLVAVDTTTPRLASAFSGAPSIAAVANAGMWGSGGPAVDLKGYVYETTGNSPVGSMDSPGVWGESLLVWNPGMPLRLAGTYTPWNYCQMDAADTDLGGSSPAIITGLDPSATSTPDLVAFGSKQGNTYIVDRNNLPGRVDQRPPCSDDPTSDTSLIPPGPQPQFGAAGPLNVFGPYSERFTQGDYAKMRTTPAYFQSDDGTGYLFVSGATKKCESCREPVPPGLARLHIIATPGRPAYLSLDAADNFLSLFSPGPPVISSSGSDNAIVWLLDANVYRSASLVGSSVPHPVLYAVDATTMQLLWKSSPSQLNVGGKYNHVTVARGVVFVGTDRIQAFGLSPRSPLVEF